MDQLDGTVRSILAHAASYKPGTIVRAEQVVDAYLDEFVGHRSRRAAMDALLRELALPERRARNRGGLFELIEMHLRRRYGESAPVPLGSASLGTDLPRTACRHPSFGQAETRECLRPLHPSVAHSHRSPAPMPKKPLSPEAPVLVVEDDGLVRTVAVDMLEDAGFDVLEAGSADAAWIILERTPGVCALFTDIDMPGSMDGLALVGRVAERWPEIRLVVTSGGKGLRDAEVPDRGRFLPKPYGQGQLLRAIGAAA